MSEEKAFFWLIVVSALVLVGVALDRGRPADVNPYWERCDVSYGYEHC